MSERTSKRCWCRGPVQCIGSHNGQPNMIVKSEKEGTWLEPGLALLRKKVMDNWTTKYGNVLARKIFLEGGWTQKKLFGIGWSDISQCQACQMEEDTEKHRLHHCPEWHAVRRHIPEVFRKWE